MGVSQLFLPEILDALSAHDPESLRAIFESLHPSDIAEILAKLDPERIAEIVKVLDAKHGIAVFEQLPLAQQSQVLRIVGRKEMIRLLEDLSSDDRVDVIRHLPPETVDEILPLMAQAERDDVRKLLQYQEGTAGSVMTTEYASLPPAITVGEAIQTIRHVAPERETIYVIYVVDPDRKLLGTLSLRDLVIAKPEVRIEDLMNPNPVFMRVTDDREDVARALGKYDLIAIPIVDDDHRLVGIVTHDDVIDIQRQEQTEDVHRMGAVGRLDVPYLKANFWNVAAKRGSWLAILFVGGTLTSLAIHRFDATLTAYAHLAWFLPLIIASGGNSGSQSATLIIRALAVGDVTPQDWMRILKRELVTSLLLGCALAVLGMAFTRFWNLDGMSSAVVSLSLFLVVLYGTVVGGLLPIGIQKMGLDPAITSSPFISCLVDVSGIVIYLTVATLVLR